MKEEYEKSLQMIKEIDIILTEKQYTELAMKHNLLSTESLRFISKKSFRKLNKEVIKVN